MTQEPEFNTSHPEYVPFSNAYIGHVMTAHRIVGAESAVLPAGGDAFLLHPGDFVVEQ